jgi:hypothetical protein
MTLQECDPEFQRELKDIAQRRGLTTPQVWEDWQRYEAACDAAGQSALLEEWALYRKAHAANGAQHREAP